jgi:hypothetical protein
VQSRAPALSRSSRAQTDRSTPNEGEFQIEVVGVDDTSLQPVHARERPLG